MGSGVPGSSESDRRIKASIYVSEAVLEAARDAVDALSGPPERLTLSALIEQAVLDEIERLQDEFNKGKPFPNRERPLRSGRRPS